MIHDTRFDFASRLGPSARLPSGAVEQLGRHSRVGGDILFADDVAKRRAAARDAFLLPRSAPALRHAGEPAATASRIAAAAARGER